MTDSLQRLLIVSPHFPPSSTADSQRVRMLLPFFREFGWEPTVLAVDAEQVSSPRDVWLEEGLPADVEVIRVKALGLRWSGVPGLRVLDFRALGALRRTGDALLSEKVFDLVYFSTTVFGVHVLGPRWKRKFGVPFVMDYQDPWVTDYYSHHSDIVPPGGKVKYAVAQSLARRQERQVLSECSAITSVSPDYPIQIRQSYPFVQDMPALVLPFPGARRDFERRSEAEALVRYFDKKEGFIHWVYTGVVIPGMLPTIRALFKAIVTALPEKTRCKLRIHFIGTSYSTQENIRSLIFPLADEYGLIEQVQEQCKRIPYSAVLDYLCKADALLAFGSNDSAYTASKIYPYLLANKPLLAVFHKDSTVVSLMRKVGGGMVVAFTNDESIEAISSRISSEWLDPVAYQKVIALKDEEFEPYTDRGSASVLCDLFNQIIAR